MNDKPRRRWFNFSLRTMFVVVTLMCGWLGWESSIVRQRQALRKALEANPTVQITTASAWADRYPGGAMGQPAATIPVVRRWLGDEAIQEIWYYSYMQGPKIDLERLAKVFPEAALREPMPEPCHPGCFPRGTLVATPQGLRSIETIVVGDLVTTVLVGGEALAGGEGADHAGAIGVRHRELAVEDRNRGGHSVDHQNAAAVRGRGRDSPGGRARAGRHGASPPGRQPSRGAGAPGDAHHNQDQSLQPDPG